MTTTLDHSFTFNGDFHDIEQVDALYPEYLVRRRELDSAGLYTYNDRFKGIWPGVTGKAEDTAIYLCQCRHSRDETRAQVAEALAAGYRVADLDAPEDRKMYADVVLVGEYSNQTGYKSFGPGRLISNGKRLTYMIPKGRRTHGHMLLGMEGYFVLIRA